VQELEQGPPDDGLGLVAQQGPQAGTRRGDGADAVEHHDGLVDVREEGGDHRRVHLRFPRHPIDLFAVWPHVPPPGHRRW
jgi:hypothetical protein